MASTAGSRRSRTWVPHAPVIGAATVVLAMAVLIAAGIHTAALGSDPSWTFDCEDSTCVDLWAGPRHHYRLVSALSCLAIAVGWVVIGLGLSALPGRRGVTRSRAARAGLRLAALAILLAPLCSLTLGTLPIGASGPLGLAGAAVPMLLAAVAGWLGLRGLGIASRTAWFLTAGELLLVAPFAAVIAALLAPLLFLASIRIVALVAGACACAVHVLVGRRIARRTPASAPASESASASDPAPASDRTPDEDGEDRSARPGLVDALCVLTLLAVSVWAAWPVPAEPADSGSREAAAESAGSSDPSDPTVSADATGSAEPSDAGRDAEVLSARGLEDCAPADLTVEITGWSAAMGDTAAVIGVTNEGAEPCALRGRPHLVLTQGGKDLELLEDAMPEYRESPRAGTHEDIGLPPGSRAEAGLFWRGYGRAADTSTPQQAEVSIGDGDPVRADLLPGAEGHGTTAPFDLVHGAHVEVGRWAPGA